jgi:hypothetical protein
VVQAKIDGISYRVVVQIRVTKASNQGGCRRHAIRCPSLSPSSQRLPTSKVSSNPGEGSKKRKERSPLPASGHKRACRSPKYQNDSEDDSLRTSPQDARSRKACEVCRLVLPHVKLEVMSDGLGACGCVVAGMVMLASWIASFLTEDSERQSCCRGGGFTQPA